MKIGDYKINLTSSHSLEQKFMEKKRTEIWIGQDDRQNSQQRVIGSFQDAFKKIKEMADNAKSQLLGSVSDLAELDGNTEDIPPMERMKADLISQMLEKLTGKKFKIFVLDPDDFQKNKSSDLDSQSGQRISAGNDAGWGAEIEVYRSFKEEEMMNFRANGLVKTADGKEIKLDLEMNFHRAFFQEEYLNVKMGNALKDPLVINFSGNAVDLTQEKFAFDIDVDGVEDMISHLNQGNGFLALDKNGNGRIDDGSELFGAQSGDGFSDLAKYDMDGNGWIDENDEIFDNLRIWEKYSDGTDRLVAIKEKDIGAIYLGNIDTQYSLANEDNSKNGYLRKSGLFLKESGGAGFVHHIDMQI